MTSAAVRAANRANAARSTGPRTRAGKAASARNALRHGLSLPVLADPALAPEAAAFAGRIAGPGASEARRAAALRIAEAQTDVLRVRGVRAQIFAEGFGADDITARLMRLDRYERRALSRRKAAIKAFDALDRAVAPTRRRDPWAAVAAAAGLRGPVRRGAQGEGGFWQNKADFGPELDRRHRPRKRRESGRSSAPQQIVGPRFRGRLYFPCSLQAAELREPHIRRSGSLPRWRRLPPAGCADLSAAARRAKAGQRHPSPGATCVRIASMTCAL